MRGNGTLEREIRRYSEALKLQVVKELEVEGLTISEAMEFYDIPNRRTIDRWREKYGKDRGKTRVVRVMMKSEQDRIRELEKALADKELENLKLKCQLAVIEEDYGEDIKKKLTPEQWERLEKLRKETAPLLEGFVKRSG